MDNRTIMLNNIITNPIFLLFCLFAGGGSFFTSNSKGEGKRSLVVSGQLRGDVFRCTAEQEGQPIVIPGIETACITCVCQDGHVNCERVACQRDGSCPANATVAQREQCCRRCLQPVGQCQVQAEEAHISTFDELSYSLDGLLSAYQQQQPPRRRTPQYSADGSKLCPKSYKFLLAKAGCRQENQLHYSTQNQQHFRLLNNNAAEQQQQQNEAENDEEDDEAVDDEIDEENEQQNDEAPDHNLKRHKNRQPRSVNAERGNAGNMDQFEVYVRYYAATPQQQQISLPNAAVASTRPENEENYEDEENESDLTSSKLVVPTDLRKFMINNYRAQPSELVPPLQEEAQHSSTTVPPAPLTTTVSSQTKNTHSFSIIIYYQRRYRISISNTHELGLQVRVNKKRVQIQADRPYVQIGAFFAFLYQQQPTMKKSMRLKFVNGAEIQWMNVDEAASSSAQNEAVKIILPRNQQWQGRTCGLCGDFDDHRSDDLQIPLYARTFPWLDANANAVLAARKWLIPIEATSDGNNNQNIVGDDCDNDDDDDEQADGQQIHTALKSNQVSSPPSNSLTRRRSRLRQKLQQQQQQQVLRKRNPHRKVLHNNGHWSSKSAKKHGQTWRETDMVLPTATAADEDAVAEQNVRQTNNVESGPLSADAIIQAFIKSRNRDGKRSKHHHQPKLKLYTVWQTLTIEK